MKMNWKVRLKNPVFWITAVPSVVAFVYLLLGAFGVTPRIASDEVITYAGTVISALTTLGVLVDPTTAGLRDSDRALEYEDPHDSDDRLIAEREEV